MKNILQKLNASNLINDFAGCDYKFYSKRYNTVLIMSIKGSVKNVDALLELAEKIFAFLKESNYRKFEFFLKLDDEADKIKLATKLLNLNYPQYIVTNDESTGVINIDFNNLKYSNLDMYYIQEMFKNIDIHDFYKRINFLNVNNGVNYEIERYSKELFKSNKNNNDNNKYINDKYIKEFDKIKAQTIYLEMIPKTRDELINFNNPKINVEGQIFAIESKALKKGFLHLIKITNYKESLILKLFSQNASLPFKVGDSVEVTGVLIFDDFIKQILLHISFDYQIKKIDAEFKKEISLNGLFEENEELRTELHVHTKFSTQDGLSSVKEYFENARNFGLKSIAIVDHENVQAYPEIEKYAKEFGVKPIYGTEVNLINKNDYKIFYKGESSKNHIVGIDIETTGFSGIYDEIIEISAYKITLDEYTDKILKKEEYSVLVKLDDYKKLSPKITELTSINKKMLEKDGIDIKSALNGLIEFIDDGILVAHNATFDVHFLQNKIKQYLGLKKNYSYIDTLNFSRSVLKDEKMKKFSLDKVCKKLKIELTEHHRAIYDAIACLEIYYSLMKKLTNISIDDENCPQCGNIISEIKVNSKKTLNLIYDFVEEEKIENYKANNLITDGSNRVNSVFEFNLNDEQNLALDKLLLQNDKIKVINRYRKNTYFNNNFENLNDLINENDILMNSRHIHATILLKNQKALKEVYKLISLSNINRISPRGNCLYVEDIISNKELRENILIGTSCANGIIKTLFEKGLDYISLDLNIFDYFEIQPIKCYYSLSDSIYKVDYIKNCVNKLIEYCNNKKKLIVASCDAHYIYPTLKDYRDVYINTFGVGGVMHPLYGVSDTGMHVLHSTSGLIKTLKNDYNFDTRFIKKIVYQNPDKINEMISDSIKIIPDKLYTPNDDFLSQKVLDIVGYKVPSIKKEFIKIVDEALKQYKIGENNKLPPYIKERVDKELKSIIGHGFYIIYYIAYLLVKKSNHDGYVVGSRGSVGSSFIAYLMGITEVNSLAPHYLCPKCHFQIYKGVKDIFKSTKITKYRQAVESVDDGFDLPNNICPYCGEKLIKDGHDIPFETFLGFNGDKTPDIDLNFSGEYQAKAHNFCKEVFGEEHAFRAGTISTVASKTAAAYLKKYNLKRNVLLSDVETSRRSQHLTDVKRTTGQHPGGIIVLPNNMEIYDFTPIQYPANKIQDWFTTHLDYNAIHENVLKMDILGHDDPTILRFLMNLVHENPKKYPFDNPKDIPIDDSKIMRFLRDDENGIIKSLGIPEFGTNFVKGMLKDIQPKTFYDLVKTSGLSHGTNVWNTNAQELVNGNTDYGKIEFKDVIGCRDDIMVQLLYRGLEPKQAFDIMEFVRKGKVSKDPEKWNEFKKIMIEHNVPKWYIWSCEKIEYMFPKAHAVAYVLSAMRIAWFKANRPLDFYQAFFTVRATVFDALTISTNNVEIINDKIKEIKENKNATDVELDSLPYLETAAEMIEMGFTFKEPIINLSHGTNFTKLNDKCLLMPFSVLDGVGKVTANNVYENRNNMPYKDIEDLKKRGKADKKFIDSMTVLNAMHF